ncbi:MAG: DUF4114 domain-containing protein [Pseudomonadota bacterium]
MAQLANSSFLDLTSWHSYDLSTNPTVETAYGLDSSNIVIMTGTTPVINVALSFPRADETAVAQFEAANWAERQQMLAELNENGTLWSTFGADTTTYQTALDTLSTMLIPVLDGGYVSSQEARTIWVSLSPDQFSALFGTDLLFYNVGEDSFFFYEGELTLPDGIAANGVMMPDMLPATQNLATTPSELHNGPQSQGNTSSITEEWTPDQIANGYNFPLTGDTSVTGTLGLIEPAYGTAMPTGSTQTFAQAVASYLSTIGIDAAPTIYSVADGGQQADVGNGERSLDIGVVSAVNPYASFAVYAGSGASGLTYSSVFAAYQSAIWDLVYNPSVLSSSFANAAFSAPGSPFYQAYQDLFLDAALRNISLVVAGGDGGSGGKVADGIANLQYANVSPYTLMVGGTSLNTALSAAGDSTVSDVLTQATAGNLQVIWNLTVGGLKTSPGALTGETLLLEVAWNEYVYDSTTDVLDPAFNENEAGAGGIDPRSGVPLYQQDYGLGTYDGVTGRGAPDVSANSAGNMLYVVPDPLMDGTLDVNGGTSAAAPLWASLLLQFDTIFQDQGLPQLGFANDLLYTASAVAVASFNDVFVGNNISSFIQGGTVNAAGEPITPTGIGYEAGPGYDLITGLGTPNGLLLARALTAIAHSQMYYSDVPDVVTSGSGSATESGASQSLLFQWAGGSEQAWTVQLGNDTLSMSNGSIGDYAWTSRLAQQSLQADFSVDLVTMFDGYQQGWLHQSSAGQGENLSVTIGAHATAQPQINLTSAFGFVDYNYESNAVTVARAVAIAETAGAADDQDAVVRIRQNGTNESFITLYEVDDLNGTINGLAPGSAGYAAAVAARAYQTTDGATAIGGAGYGQFSQNQIVGVDAGDLIAMSLSSGGQTYYAFANANEQVDGKGVAHLWSYGLNTWGWEDLYGGGDRDFNDLVVQLDFTSASGSGFLI